MANLIQFFGEHVIVGTLHRRAAGSIDSEGDWTQGAETTSDINVVIPQPVTADEIELENDGESIRDYKQTWTETEVRTRTDTVDADHITAEGIEYKVHQCNDWRTEGGFINVVLRRV